MKTNGCHNRAPFSTETLVQDGWINVDGTRLPRMVRTPFRMSQECQYSRDPMGYGQKDPQCTNCQHRFLKEEAQ